MRGRLCTLLSLIPCSASTPPSNGPLPVARASSCVLLSVNTSAPCTLGDTTIISGWRHAPGNSPKSSCPFTRPWERCVWAHQLQSHTCLLTAVNATELLTTFAGRKILFVGDSLHVQLVVALLCALHDQRAETVSDRRRFLPPNSTKVLAKRCQGAPAERCHWEQGCVDVRSQPQQLSTTICSCFVVGMNVSVYQRCLLGGLHKRGRVRERAVRAVDVVVYGSVAVHYREMGQDHQQSNATDANARREFQSLWSAFTSIFRSKKQRPLLIWREASAQHFAAPGGHYTGTRDYNELDVSHECTSHSVLHMLRHQRWNPIANAEASRHGVPVLRVWASSSLRGDAHVGRGDCTHFCQGARGGVLGHWAELLSNMLLGRGLSRKLLKTPTSRSGETTKHARIRLSPTMAAGPIAFTEVDASSTVFAGNVAGFAEAMRASIDAGCLPCSGQARWVVAFENDARNGVPTQHPDAPGTPLRLIKYQLEALSNPAKYKANTIDTMNRAEQLWCHSWADCKVLDTMLARRRAAAHGAAASAAGCRVVPLYLSLPSHHLNPSPLSNACSAPPIYDALLFGSLNPERHALCAELASIQNVIGQRLRVRCTSQLYGDDLRRAIRQSRLVFGLEYYQNTTRTTPSPCIVSTRFSSSRLQWYTLRRTTAGWTRSTAGGA